MEQETSYKRIFRQILDDYRVDRDLRMHDVEPRPILRNGEFSILSGKASVITGVRRAGKSTLLTQMAESWKNLPSKRSKSIKREYLAIDFTDERLIELKVTDLQALLDVVEDIRLSDDGGFSEVLLILDEIQEVRDWELFVTRVLKKPGFYVSISGSSAKMLSKEIATQLRGRTLNYELFPFSFLEYMTLSHQSMKSQSTPSQAALRKKCLEFLEWGGFPEVALVREKRIKKNILRGYLDTLLLRDVIERNAFSQVHLVHVVQNSLFSQYASLLSVNRLMQKLKSMGIKFDKNILPEIISAFEDAYSIFLVPIYSESFKKRQINPKKLYLVDQGWASLQGLGMAHNKGRLLENFVFLELRRREFQIFYGKTPGGNEIDFIFHREGSECPDLLQVCWDLDPHETFARETEALREAMALYKVKHSKIVTFDNSREVRFPEGIVQIQTIFDFVNDLNP